jgi:chromosome segregation ATPase
LGILTKIFIITLVVLILIACPIFIRQATVAPSWRNAWESMEAKYRAAEQNAAASELGAVKLAEQYRLLQQSSAEAAGAAGERADRLEAELRTVRQERQQLQGNLDAMAVEISRLRADYEVNTRRTDLLDQQRQEAFTRLENLNQENRHLSGQVQQLQLEADRQREIGRMLNEQLVEREDRIRQLEQMIAQGGGAPVAAASATQPAGPSAELPRITGTVTAVQNDMASVNIGSAKGIKAGMQLVIYRGPEFVAQLRVQEVRVDEAAGLITNKRLEVQQGDKVATRL